MTIGMSEEMKNYAKIMHGPAYRAFLSFCRQPRSAAALKLANILDDYATSDKASHRAAGVLRHYIHEIGTDYEDARDAVIRAIVIQDLIP